MDPLLEQFLNEARENLAFIEQNIEDIGGADPELLNSVFRAAHTLKGGSGIVGFDSVRDITHHAEDLLDMLRDGRIAFADGMTEALFDAFDEVLNLIEAAEETQGIVEADEDTLKKIITSLSEQMGKDAEAVASWEVGFLLVEDAASVVNMPLNTLRECSSQTIAFKNTDLDEEFCANENFYAVVFDIDESCMVYGNDPIYTLSLLGDKVLGVYSCMSDDNAKSVLSGTEDEDGLLLRVQLTAFIKATFEEIEDALFNFIDELQFLPLDISTLLSINVGESGHKIDSLKELNNIAEDLDLAAIVEEVKRSMALVGNDTLQYAQLQRFIDISGLIADYDTTKLCSFFNNLYRGEVYTPDENIELTDALEDVSITEDNIEEEIEAELEAQASEEESEVLELSESNKTIELTEDIVKTIKNISEQQLLAVDYIKSDDDLQRVKMMMDKIRKFVPEMPEDFKTKDEIKVFLQSQVGSSTEKIEPEEMDIETVIDYEVEDTEEVFTQEFVASESIKKVESKKVETHKTVVGKTVKIDQESIDSLMNVVGELLVAKNSLPYLADNVVGMTHETIKREIMDKYIFINRLSEQLQDLIMGMRMLPISYVFDRYPKLVRDISKKLGKKVKLEMYGGETKLDKNMIEMLADPMIHIMRNSLDHGVEMPDVREQKGKNSSGNVTLKAFAQSDKIIIEIQDDGAGINVDRVAGKVLEKGLMTPEQIDALSEDEMAELVLLPGLSTAEEITEFSGRGVGMDVVKKSIEGFGGSIGIKTKPNQGTLITLSIPMSLAVTSLLHIQMNDIHYGLPMDSVSETVKIYRSEIEYLHNEPFVYIRGEVIPLLFIKSMLNEKVVEDEPLSIVVLNIKNNLLAVVVNKFLGQLDVVQKPLVGILEKHPLFSGTALLGNGQIIMAIDPIGLLGISQKLKEYIAVA
ncbi:chemotaxis protein CheA [Sulfurimonas gotlandica GD1]|uniref:Chemotaxis protein CheA n=1 Tax=Sulfurimonas gotlandica (strain DSM 19862 / JCM 16533 / GD1) TaxID=929558 RepID=B6BNV1_SULGG|nr:chemotaxis protein CheA [Sulfurimonas gotlandica]EDZ61249.1 chemotaxis protein CheA [Sulfurimonas gotlandica GD1]EHP28905.1 chemotaxis protein CheA [Sulfurimonas gotlandica GD1]